MNKPSVYYKLTQEQRTEEARLRAVIWGYEKLLDKYLRGDDCGDCKNKCPLCEMFRAGITDCTECPNATHEKWNCKYGGLSKSLSNNIRGLEPERSERIAYIESELPKLKARLLDLMESAKQPKPHVFERGDRVRHDAIERDGDVLEVYPDKDINDVLVQFDGWDSPRRSTSSNLTLVTAARDREIQVGDTFECDNKEFIAKVMYLGQPNIIWDTDGNFHRKDLSIFRQKSSRRKRNWD